jgi:DNA-binding MurR/RpiR family transcriptional regulator
LPIKNHIAAINERLTPTQRRIAEAVLEDKSLLTFGNVSELADRVGTSRASIVRFATKLGFEGYSELQQYVREELSARLTSPSHRVRQQDASIAPIQLSVDEAIRTTFETLDDKTIKAMATPIVSAINVWILSGETSMAGAHTLHSGLSMIRPNVHFVDEHSTGRELCGASKVDVAIIFDFTRYRKNSVFAARALADLGVQLVAITDGPLSPLASLTNNRCELTIPAVGPFDSSLPAVLAAELLVAQVVSELGDEARDRIDRLEMFWQATGTFLHYSPRPDRNS